MSALGAHEWQRWKNIRLESLLEAPYAFGSTHTEALSFTDEDWASHLDRGPYLIAQQHGRDVGIVRLSPGEEDGLWWLYSLWIDPAARGSGLVNTLVNLAEDTAREHGARVLRLDVTRQNSRAIAAYLRLGYEVFEDPADEQNLELVFSKNLEQQT